MPDHDAGLGLGKLGGCCYCVKQISALKLIDEQISVYYAELFCNLKLVDSDNSPRLIPWLKITGP